jgi:hypothetical protein
MTAFNAATAVLAPATQTWGATCSGPSGFVLLAPVDSVAGPRAVSCTAAINPTGSTPNSPAEEECKRCSFMHPDTTGHTTIANSIRIALGLQGLFRRP